MKLQVTSIVLLSIFGLTAGVARVEGQGRAPKSAAEWEKAGANRESAAADHESQGDALVTAAAAFLNSKPDGDGRHGPNMNLAGDCHKRAGDLYGAAVKNLDQASVDWRKAASVYQGADMAERQRDAGERADAAHAAATAAAEKAARSYETAAELYQDPLVKAPGKAAAVSEKAAEWREKLATR